jgi:hypothetical protein
VVVEGAAAGIRDWPRGSRSSPPPHSGDDQIVDIVRAPSEPITITVVTSDRALRARVEALGAATVGPHWLWGQLAPSDP